MDHDLLDVLVVDDDPASVELAGEAVEGWAQVRSARTLAGALTRCAERVPACVVLDLGLPDADGLSGLRRLVDAHPDVPVVVLTGAGVELVDPALQQGAEDYVQKDELVEQLPRAVHHAVGRAQRRRLLSTVVEHAAGVISALPEAALVLDGDLEVAAVNDAAVALLSLTQDDDGRWTSEQLPYVDVSGRALEPADTPACRVLRTGRADQGRELGVRRSDGSVRWVEVDARPLSNADGEVFGVVQSLRDVTARREAEQRNRFQASLLDAVGQAVIATDAGGTVLYWNRAAQDLYGWTADEALGQSILDLTPSEQSVEQAAEVMAALRAGLTWTGDFTVRRRDGSSFTALVTNRPLLDGDGEVVGVIGVSTDITERVEAELAARRTAAIVESSGDAVVLVSPLGLVEGWNRAAEELFGWTAAEVVGRLVVDLLVAPGGDEGARFDQRLRGGQPVRDLEGPLLRADGTTVEVSLTVSPVLDRTGAVAGASITARDITERRTWQRALQHAALHDDLTGLPNRTLLGDRLEQLTRTAVRTGEPVAALFVDLDAFKDINDAEGHLLGDAVLREVAGRLEGAARPGDTVARFGGDEFVVLLPGADETTAADVAERLLDAVRAPLEVEGHRLHVTASLGLAVSPPVDADALLRAADAAVYDAKENGRNQVRAFVGELSHRAEQRLALSGDLSDALDRDALGVVYQPVVCLDTGTVLGVEALVRWDHPELGPLPPTTFVPVAEKTGLARRLDDWVLRRSCLEFAALRDAWTVPRAGYLAVNVTAANVVDPAFPATVRAALEEAGLPASSLVLEVTETGVMNDLDTGVRMLTALTELGVRIAIDDFGTGWSSLTYVKRLPASFIKLDRSFVARLHEDAEDLAIAASVVRLGEATGMTVVAEGVETPGQLAVLRQLRCGAGQGWLWHKAVPATGLAQALVTTSTVWQQQPQATSAALPRQAAAPGPEHGLERLYQLHGEGASMATIAAALNKEGFRNAGGQRWHRKSVAAVLGQAALAAPDEHRRGASRV